MAPKEVLELVEQFERNIDSYRNPAYNEAQVRQEFINPLFEALGWDMANRQGYAEAYKEVIHEAAVKVGAATKAPDYAFRIGGTKKFFLEAKKPGVDLKNNSEPAYQLRRYAWSARLPLSILTDFEEFAVYDCRIKPSPKDKASAGRTLYLTYREYESRWAEIAGIFDKQSIQQGSFDRYAEGAKGKRGTSPVDDAFLKEIEDWRSELAHNIARRNPRLKVRDLNFAVQRTIDRIIFLRMCEDRGIESYGQLQSLLNGVNVYSRLRQIYDLADDKYNSGLFHFQPEKDRAEQPDELTPKLKIDDKVLKDIISRLYYPESPYEFSVLSGDILGNVYEQFLGKVIHLTKTHQARIEEKPEVKKAGGVYYTPKYIVDYIVKNTVGKLCENKTPKQIEKLKILDPACGSGSFLIGAYSYLLDYHREWYEKKRGGTTPSDPSGLVPLRKGDRNEIFQGSGGEWYLTTQKKKEILLNNIYGVDIDSQAVEVTKLNLLLKVLENETKDTLESQMKLWRHRALPDLGNNIKCGNSLIGPDYYHGKQLSLLDEEEQLKVNPFDWKAEFSETIKSGGFDAVIGNPPYTLIGSDQPDQQAYLRVGFKLSAYKINTYLLFLERGLSLLGKDGAILGYIIPKSLVFNTYFEGTRRSLLSDFAIPEIIEIRDKVFENAEVGDSILFFAQCHRAPQTNTLVYSKVRNIYPVFELLEKYRSPQKKLLSQSHPSFFFSSFAINVPTKELDQLADVSNGLNPGNVRQILFSKRKASSKHQRLLLGRDIQHYILHWSGTWVNYDPALKNRLKLADTKSKRGMTAQKRVDFALRDPEIYAKNKIMIRKTADHIVASLDTMGFYFDSLSYGVQVLESCALSPKYLLGLLNSQLLNYIHGSFSMNKEKVFAKVLAENLKRLPIRIINFSDPTDKLRHDRMVQFVEQMLTLHKQLAVAKTPDDKTRLQRHIDAADRQIDQLVYELYGLTEEEIAVVEGKAT